MPKFTASKSIKINAPIQQLYDSVRDFKQWTEWSPWLIAEPDCKVTHAEDGRGYSWDGKIVGSGEIVITGEQPPEEIQYKLTFLKPWKSVSEVIFKFTESDGGTEATWTMNGSLPFFMFWMKRMMTVFIGMDFQRGLNMLKDHVETGTIPCKLEFLGAQPFSSVAFVGIRNKSSIADIGLSMGDDFKKLQDSLCEMNLQPSGNPFSIYHKWGISNNTTEYTIAYPVESVPLNLPEGITSGEIPNCQVYSIKHTGPYRHISNAWSSGMMHSRGKVFKKSKAIMPFEVYENDPNNTPENDLITYINFPIK